MTGWFESTADLNVLKPGPVIFAFLRILKNLQEKIIQR
jgi:hypothetical protein